MKIINISKKSDFITRDMRSFSGRFESVRGLKLKLMEEFDTLVPSSLVFDVGYFSGKQSKKQWLIEETDLLEMYDNMKKVTVYYYGVIGGYKLQSNQLNKSVNVQHTKMHPKLSDLS